MLLVSKTKPRYIGRFKKQAEDLVRAGKRVGMMWIGPDDTQVHCHVCDKDFNKPVLDPEHKDSFGECPHCHTPFIFASIEIASMISAKVVGNG